jgi:uncharacterized membrane protein YedE/YeeE
MMALVAVFLAGVIFALGLGISGMTNADKVIGFLDVSDQWDASLAFVMVGAIGVHLVSYRLMANRESPLLAEMFRVPTTQHIDKPLLVGASLFGVGWGLGGYCPGPGIVSGVTLGPEALTYVAGMLLGMVAYRFGMGGRSAGAPSAQELSDG